MDHDPVTTPGQNDPENPSPVPGGEVAPATDADVQAREEQARDERRATEEEADGQQRYEGGEIPPAPVTSDQAPSETPGGVQSESLTDRPAS